MKKLTKVQWGSEQQTCLVFKFQLLDSPMVSYLSHDPNNPHVLSSITKLTIPYLSVYLLNDAMEFLVLSKYTKTR